MGAAPVVVDPRELRAAAERVVRELQEAGHTAYFAGGCVRDWVMGRAPDDYDVATDAPPRRVLELFRISRQVGEAFGVVMVRVRGCWIEVATFRTDWGYTDGRRPDRLAFSDAEHDARRRDFTVNGLFYDPIAERLIDYVGGRRDIERRLIRAIGDPERRFAEDYLRMLRAVRFAAKLAFEIESETAEAIRRHASKLRRISRERIGMELRLMLEHPRRATAARLVQRLRLDAPVLDEPSVEREPAVLGGLPADAAYPTALAAWAIDRHARPDDALKPPKFIEMLRRIRTTALVHRWRAALVLSNEQRAALRDLLRLLPPALGWFDLTVPRRKRLMAESQWPALRQLLGAVVATLPEGAFDDRAFERDVSRLRREGVAPAPLVTGDDLIAAGLKPGPHFKRILEQTYDAQLDGRVTTSERARAYAIDVAERLSVE